MPYALAARQASAMPGRPMPRRARVEGVSAMADGAECKRRQDAPGLVVGDGDFDLDWRTE